MSASDSLVLRLALVALLCCAGLTSAACTPTIAPPTMTADCSATLACKAARCTCFNGTWSATAYTCSASSSNCAAAQACQSAYISCFNTAVNATCQSSYYLALLSVASGAAYSNSSIYGYCQQNSCEFFNQTSVPSCTDYSTVCVAPPTSGPTPTPTPTPTPGFTLKPTLSPGQIKMIATLRIGGNFTLAMLSDPVQYAKLSSAVKADLERILGYNVTINNMTIGSLIVTFTVEGANSDPTLAANLQSAAASSSWLTSTQSTYTALGGTGQLTVLGLAPTNSAVTPAPSGGAAGRVAVGLAALAAALAFFV